jgi:hypothetical protein
VTPEIIAPAIDHLDIGQVLSSHSGNRIFEKTLEKAVNSDDLLRLLAGYIHFNSSFGSGVANLAGEIGACRDLFRDPDEAIQMLADRSVDVAAKVFYAAIDEFGDAGSAHRSTHRCLAQATFKASAEFFGYDPGQINQLVRINEATAEALRKVCDGYGINQALDERQVFQGIGFHLASETLADEEFCILDTVLRSNHPELVEYLENAHAMIGGTPVEAYRWVRIHMTVEAEHRDAALASADLAVRYYAGAQTQDCVRRWIVEGIQRFAAIQAEFMEGLTSPEFEECTTSGGR